MIASTRSPARTARGNPVPDGNDVLIVGAGMGGLAAALHLSTLGLEATVVEKEPTPGGKIRQCQSALGGIDMGPTVCTMRWVFDELLSTASRGFDELVDARPLGVIAHHRWQDGSRLDLHADPEHCRDAIGRFAGMAEVRRHERFLAQAEQLYRTLESGYLKRSEPSLTGLLRRAGLSGMVTLAQVGPFRSLWQRLCQSLGDPRLRQLYARYATYCGCSPLYAPATLMLIAHVERQGVWRIRGGMGRLVEALAGEARDRGVHFRHNDCVDAIEIRNGRAAGVRLSSGEVLAARAVIVNGDVRDLRIGGLGSAAQRAVRPSQVGDRSLSAVTWAGMGSLPATELNHHNVFFSADYPAEFRALFEQQKLPDDPTVYLCAADRPYLQGETGQGDRLFFLVNAPANGDHRDFDAARCASEAAAHASRTLARCGLEFDLGAMEMTVTTPGDFHRLFPSTGGALYGSATHDWRAAFRRSGCRSRLPGLYLAGGSIHPGPGVPMAALSGLGAARSAAADLGALPRQAAGAIALA